MPPDEQRLRDVFNRLERYLEDRYEIPVVISDVPNPFTGDLDGEEIRVDYDLDVEEAVFIVAHLFGHTVQWNVSERARQIGVLQTAPVPDDTLREVAEYEAEACSYSMQLFHEVGVHDLDQWLSDFASCDHRYLMHFYRTGEKRPFRSFWEEGAPLLAPRPIPDFRPTRWVARADGIVV